MNSAMLVVCDFYGHCLLSWKNEGNNNTRRLLCYVSGIVKASINIGSHYFYYLFYYKTIYLSIEAQHSGKENI